MRAAIRRICTGCESSPASSPTRSTSALAVGVVVPLFQLWSSSELLFSFSARVVLPQLLTLAISHVFVLQQIVIVSSFPTRFPGSMQLVLLSPLCQDRLVD